MAKTGDKKPKKGEAEKTAKVAGNEAERHKAGKQEDKKVAAKKKG